MFRKIPPDVLCRGEHSKGRYQKVSFLPFYECVQREVDTNGESIECQPPCHIDNWKYASQRRL